MFNSDASSDAGKDRFSYCPHCGRKGMYHIKVQYCRCRYCGTYMIAAEEKQEIQKPDFVVTEATG